MFSKILMIHVLQIYYYKSLSVINRLPSCSFPSPPLSFNDSGAFPYLPCFGSFLLSSLAAGVVGGVNLPGFPLPSPSPIWKRCIISGQLHPIPEARWSAGVWACFCRLLPWAWPICRAGGISTVKMPTTPPVPAATEPPKSFFLSPLLQI